MSATREHAHELIDRLPDAQVDGLVRFLEAIVDPAEAALRAAAFEDEELSAEEEEAVTEAHQWLRDSGGKGISHDEAMRRLGL